MTMTKRLNETMKSIRFLLGLKVKLRILTCITSLRSAFPVRMSYRVKVLSDPTEPRIEDSDKLKRTEVTVSVEVVKVRLEIGVLLRTESITAVSL